jgi:hypothetical protein
MKECSCHGMNQNCMFCSGSGYISGSRAMTSVVPSYKVERKLEKPFSLPPNARPLGKFACIRCLEPCQSKAELDRHLLEKHFRRCEFCDQLIDEKKYKSHLKQNHPADVEAKNPLVPCPHCASRVRQTRLELHIFKIHLEHAPKCYVSLGGKRKKRSPKKDEVQKRSRQEPREKHSPHLDGSRGFHQFRENGRFGSHPSHDDHGDEGKP